MPVKSPAMETLLPRQLQQALLQIQTCNQQQQHQADLSSRSPTSNGHGSSTPLNSPLQEKTSPPPTSSILSSSRSPAADGSWVSAASTAALPLQQDLGEDSFRDPVLQYINDMLMEEEMEDRKCMMQECTSYYATVKGFYDILGADEDASRVNEVERSAQVNEVERSAQEEDQFRVSVQEDDHFRFSGREEGPLRFSAQEGDPPRVSAYEDERAWRTLENTPAIVAPTPALWSSDSLGSVLLSLQPSSDISSQASNSGVSQQDPVHEADTLPSQAKASMWYDKSVFAGFSSLNFPWYGHGVQTENKANRQNRPILGSNGSDLDWSHGTDHSKPFRRPISDTLEMLARRRLHAANGSRLKRAASQPEGEQGSRSISSPLPGSSDITFDSRREEVVSFVQNKHLNAESFVRVLNDELACMGDEKAFRIPPAFGRGALTFATSVDLRSLLVSCAQAVAADNTRKAHEILLGIRQGSSPYGDYLQRLAHYFAEGLAARLSGTGGRLCTSFINNGPSAVKILKVHHLFTEVSPCLKVSFYFTNRAILAAAKGACRLHIVDYGISHGIQWPYLISALAEREGGPPLLRITGIDFPQPGIKSAERVEMTGRQLAEYAKTYGVPFEYHAVASEWENVQTSSLHLRQDEVLVVNSMYRLHHLLDETVSASNPRTTVLSKIHSMNPKIFVQGIKNGSLNSPFFMPRFKEALTVHSSKFDMLDTTTKRDNQERMMIERELLGKYILNIVACEGPERVERIETYRQWQNRTHTAGFEQLPLNQNVVRDAKAIVKCTYDKNFCVDDDGGWMLLGWRARILYGLSLWKPMLPNGHH